VQRRQLRESGDPVADGAVDGHRTGEPGATVDHPDADRVETGVRCGTERVTQRVDVRHPGVRGDTAVHRGPVAAVDEVDLDAAGTRVDHEDPESTRASGAHVRAPCHPSVRLTRGMKVTRYGLAMRILSGGSPRWPT